MSVKTNLLFVLLYCVAVQLCGGQVLSIDSMFCGATDVHVVCRGVDARGYSVIEYSFNAAWSVSIVDSPHLSVVPKKFVASFELRLSNTALQDLTGDDFEYARIVKKLDLSANRIRNLTSDVFTNIPNLRYLNLSHNQLEALPDDGLFSGNPHLQELDLAGNALSRISPALFTNRPILFLNVSFNKLWEDLQFLWGLPHLMTLDLSGNCLRHLPPSTFVDNHELQILSLSRTCLGVLDYGSFPYDTLRELDFSHNSMYPDFGVFVTIPSLEKLNLRGNRPDLANIRVLLSLVKLQELELEQDFYRCQDLVAIVNELRKLNIKLIISDPHFATSNINGLKCKNIQ